MISHTLGCIFPAAEIWKEQVDEDFSRPAFCIQRITGVFQQAIGNRYYEENAYMIVYFSDKDRQSTNGDLWNVADLMRQSLKQIVYKDETLNGKDINYRIEDGVLQFFVTYSRHLREPIETTKVNEIKIEME